MPIRAHKGSPGKVSATNHEIFVNIEKSVLRT